MDSICAPSEGGFKLQTQQRFLKKFISNNPNWDRLLLYHQIGSGKTCTAISIAEKWRKLDPSYKIVVILPARLRTNFIDELVSPCGLEMYLDADEFERYNGATEKERKKIRSAFMAKINDAYTILSFEKWKTIQKNTSLKTWVKELTSKTLIIVDEVHNLLSNNYDAAKYAEMEKTHKKTNAKGAATMLFKYMTKNAAPSAKFVFMTATPIFDNIGQFKELVECLQKERVSKMSTIEQALPLLKNKVSYFPGISPDAYPEVVYNIVEVPFSETQDRLTEALMLENSDDYDDGKEAFMSKQRQIAVSCGKKPLSDPDEYCPKIAHVLKLVNKHKGAKHLIYSSFVKQGISLVADALEEQGWTDLKDLKYDKDNIEHEHQYKVFATWDGKTKDVDKQRIKSIVNSRDNRYGKHVRVILGSPSMKEGVSFKHIQHMHILDPAWNVSTKDQIEGRAIRFCSHAEMPSNSRKVHVHNYKSVPNPDGLVERTCDQIIYEIIMPRKELDIRAGEYALRSIALDRKLFGTLYTEDDTKKNNALYITKSKFLKTKASSCPKRRRPNPFLNECVPSIPFLRPNSKGDDCCYKKDVATKKSKK